MSAPICVSWTQERFFAWASDQEGRYEFDGVQPVAMTGGSVNRSRMIGNVNFALRQRLRFGPCEPLGPDAGVETADGAVRYPDALVTCSPQPSGAARIVIGPVVVFEIVSPSSGRTDRIVKVREYGAVPSIRRYVILESASVGLLVFERQAAGEAWQARALTADDVLLMPEIGIEIPVAEFYERLDLSDPTRQVTG